VSDPATSSAADTELRAHVERALGAHYELDCEIGRGGMGIVYRAKDRRLKRTVAIKVLPPELAFRSEIKSRFLREAETAAQLNHPNIVDIYSVDEAEGIVYFVMAYVAGDNLAKRLHDRGVLAPDETRRILREVADALAYAHERGVVHRDIKPDNILLDLGSGRPMVTDFGIARAITEGGDSRLTATGMAIGTPAYMSPEQAAGEREIDGRSDLYSLGIVAYQMLVGEPPFVATSTPAMLVKHLSERPTPLAQRRADVPEDLALAVMRCLEKDPASRHPSATALVAALDGLALPETMGRSSTGVGALPQPFAAPLPTGGAPAYDDRWGTLAQTGGAPSALDQWPGASAGWSVADEDPRWSAPEVVRFRRKLAPYLFINAVICIASILGVSDFFGITVLWSIYIAYKYARLWSDGYDWRDVFKQPRDRELIDVADDGIEYVKALFNDERRQTLRERRRQRKLDASARAAARAQRQGGVLPPVAPVLGAGQLPSATNGATPPSRPSGLGTRMSQGANLPSPRPMAVPPGAPAPASAYGPHHERVRQAVADRDAIVDLWHRLAKPERDQLPDVQRSAVALSEKVQALALALADLERELPSGGPEAIEAEIERLHAEANPEDPGSEQRVRRLVALKRQRQGVREQSRRRGELQAKLESCSLALQNIRTDLLRLRSGGQSQQRVTTLVNEAMSLAERVDSALYVADEMGRLDGRRGAPAHPSA
jgi:serine/threonine-protein kinase